jgi:hypothetical protein
MAMNLFQCGTMQTVLLGLSLTIALTASALPYTGSSSLAKRALTENAGRFDCISNENLAFSNYSGIELGNSTEEIGVCTTLDRFDVYDSPQGGKLYCLKTMTARFHYCQADIPCCTADGELSSKVPLLNGPDGILEAGNGKLAQCPDAYIMRYTHCEGSFCDRPQIGCMQLESIQPDNRTRSTTNLFSDSNFATEAKCPKHSAATGLGCSDDSTRCGIKYLTCEKLRFTGDSFSADSASLPGIQAGQSEAKATFKPVSGSAYARIASNEDEGCQWEGPFSEENSASKGCARLNSVLRGMRCAGNHCDEIEMFCCPVIDSGAPIGTTIEPTSAPKPFSTDESKTADNGTVTTTDNVLNQSSTNLTYPLLTNVTGPSTDPTGSNDETNLNNVFSQFANP